MPYKSDRHIIFTRVGVDGIGFGACSTSEKLVESYCNLWLKSSSKFYTAQTTNVPVTVAIQYSLRYAKIVKSFDWPPWVALDMNDRLLPFIRENHEALAGKRILVSRLDADDSYAIDFFEALEKEPSGLIIHKRFKQYNILTGELTDEMVREGSHFATVIWDEFPADLEKLKFNTAALRNNPKVKPRDSYIQIDDNHKYICKNEHRVLDGCFCLERVTGYNYGNFWKHPELIRRGSVKAKTNPVKSSKVLDPRFVGY